MRSSKKAKDFSDKPILCFLSNVKETANSLLLGFLECQKTKNSSFAVPSLSKLRVIVAILIFGAWAGVTELKAMEPASEQNAGKLFIQVTAYDDNNLDEDCTAKTGKFRFKSDFLYGTFTNSNFGDGSTDVKGHLFRFRFALEQNIAVSSSYYHNQIGLENGGIYQMPYVGFLIKIN